MKNEELLYVEDANKRKLFYRFTPAAVISNFVPLLVILHDEGRAESAPHFEYKMWNVLTPLDDFGYEKRGSFWLGEKGDLFVRDLLQELIRKVSQEYECEDHIYLCGSGMGGYGAILHGILCKANAVYAHTPKIRLVGTDDTDSARKGFYASIFADTVPKENDLCNFLNSSDAFPIFYLCDHSGSLQNTDESSLNEETAYFAEACTRNSVKFDLDHCPNSEADEVQSLQEVLDMLERVTP